MRRLSNSHAIRRIDRLDSSPALRGPVRDAGHGPAYADAEPAPPSLAQRGAADVEVSVRVHRDGTQVTVVRRTVPEGSDRRTVGIEAVIR